MLTGHLHITKYTSKQRHVSAVGMCDGTPGARRAATAGRGREESYIRIQGQGGVYVYILLYTYI